jgi:D-alanine-D-alanine ligase-like ATP-grasp enzyme
MKNVIFVAPYFMEATERFIKAAIQVADTRVGLVSCDPLEKLSQPLRQRLSFHYAVNDIGVSELLRGVQAIGQAMGRADCLLGMLEQIQVPLGEIRDRLGIPGMSARVANHFRDKGVMKDVLRAAGMPTARHGVANSIEAAQRIAAQVGFPLIVKPPDGAGSKGTFRCENMQQMLELLAYAPPTSGHPQVIEEFVIGTEHSFDSVCIDGKIVWSSISQYSPSPLDVVREPWIQWCVMIPREVDQPQYQPIRSVAQAALRALGMETGLSHMEWFLRPDGSAAISEVGARPPGAQFTSLMSYAHDVDLYQAWAELMIHNRFHPPERKYAAGAAYLRGMGQGRVAQIYGLKEVADDLGPYVVEAKIPQAGQASSGTYEGDGFIIVRHPETHMVENMLKRIISSVRIQLDN